MKRSRLRNYFFKHKMGSSRTAYKKQQNLCTSLLRKSKTSSFQNLDSKIVSDNRTFQKSVSPLFLNKAKSNEKVILVEHSEMISEDPEIAKTFKNYFNKIV